MSIPVNPSTEKVEQSFLPISIKPSAPSRFPISYSDNIWDVVNIESTLSGLTGNAGQFDQHTLNELFANQIYALLQSVGEIWDYIQGQPTHNDFTDDFSGDFD